MDGTGQWDCPAVSAGVPDRHVVLAVLALRPGQEPATGLGVPAGVHRRVGVGVAQQRLGVQTRAVDNHHAGAVAAVVGAAGAHAVLLVVALCGGGDAERRVDRVAADVHRRVDAGVARADDGLVAGAVAHHDARVVTATVPVAAVAGTRALGGHLGLLVGHRALGAGSLRAPHLRGGDVLGTSGRLLTSGRSAALAATLPATSRAPMIAPMPAARLVQIFTLLLLLRVLRSDVGRHCVSGTFGAGYPGDASRSYDLVRELEHAGGALPNRVETTSTRPATIRPRSPPEAPGRVEESTAVRVPWSDKVECTAVPSSWCGFAISSALASGSERTAASSLAAGVSAVSAGMAVPLGTAAASGAGRTAAWARSGESSTRAEAPSNGRSRRLGPRRIISAKPGCVCSTLWPPSARRWRTATTRSDSRLVLVVRPSLLRALGRLDRYGPFGNEWNSARRRWAGVGRAGRVTRGGPGSPGPGGGRRCAGAGRPAPGQAAGPWSCATSAASSSSSPPPPTSTCACPISPPARAPGSVRPSSVISCAAGRAIWPVRWKHRPAMDPRRTATSTRRCWSCSAPPSPTRRPPNGCARSCRSRSPPPSPPSRATSRRRAPGWSPARCSASPSAATSCACPPSPSSTPTP